MFVKKKKKRASGPSLSTPVVQSEPEVTERESAPRVAAAAGDSESVPGTESKRAKKRRKREAAAAAAASSTPAPVEQPPPSGEHLAEVTAPVLPTTGDFTTRMS